MEKDSETYRDCQLEEDWGGLSTALSCIAVSDSAGMWESCGDEVGILTDSSDTGIRVRVWCLLNFLPFILVTSWREL